jgi:hypothetical protein
MAIWPGSSICRKWSGCGVHDRIVLLCHFGIDEREYQLQPVFFRLKAVLQPVN